MKKNILTFIKKGINRIADKKGDFLLEAVTGTAIYAVVMVFFALVCMSAFMMMQKAYAETQVSEALFARIENHDYSDPNKFSIVGPVPVTSAAVRFVADDIEDSSGSTYYISAIRADGSQYYDSTPLPDFYGPDSHNPYPFIFSRELVCVEYSYTDQMNQVYAEAIIGEAN